MKYIYDGTFDGLLTLIFDSYKFIEDIEMEKENDQVGFFDSLYVKRDLEKANRVKNSLIKNFSKDILGDFFKIFLSDHIKKEYIIGVCIKNIYRYGINFLSSAHEYAVAYRGILKNFSRELHSYKGLLRFREIQDNFLLAEFSPQNDILIFLARHFLKRMPKEDFIICDDKRKKAAFCQRGRLKILDVESLSPIDSENEKFFRSAWVNFYDSVAIEERKNIGLMISNMPKKYWKYLPEKNKRL